MQVVPSSCAPKAFEIFSLQGIETFQIYIWNISSCILGEIKSKWERSTARGTIQLREARVLENIMNQPEITLNLWYVGDELGIIYSLRARAYIGEGSDGEKLEDLRKHAGVDYLIAKAFPIPAKFYTNGQPIFHKTALAAINPVELFEEAISFLQSELPVQTSLDIPTSPLVCFTWLMGDDDGNVGPTIDEVDYF
jgi:hypothetical protein